MSIDEALILVGLMQVFVGWAFFRHSGQKFWVFAPVWRASDFLSAPGVSLWVGGMCAMFVGAMDMVYSKIS